MSDMGQVYTEAYFRRRARYRAPYHAFARTICEVWQPRSLLDLGCGAGYILEWFIAENAARRARGEAPIPLMGIEGSAGALSAQSPEVRARVLQADLTGPPRDSIDWFEFIVSIEVAEHIEPRDVDAYLAWFRAARRVLFSAAPPGQGGLCHVNEQPPDYWIERFGALGLEHRPEETLRWRNAVAARTKGCPWVRRNSMFFSRGQGAALVGDAA